MSRPKWQQRLVSWAKLVFTPIAFMCIAWFAWQSRDLLIDVFSTADWGGVALAGLIWGGGHFVSPLFYARVFRPRGVNLDYCSALMIHVRYLPAKYIPGGIWHTVGRIAEFRSIGIDPKSIAVFLFLENLFAVVITFLFGSLLLCLQKGWMLWEGGVLLVFVLASVGLFVGFPAVNLRRLSGGKRVSFFQYLLMLCVVILFWLLATIAFVLYVGAMSNGLGVPPAVETAGIYLFSWGVGYVSLFAPQGVGVFETVVSMLLDSDISITALMVVVAGFRVVVLVADMTVYSIVKLSGYMGIVGR